MQSLYDFGGGPGYDKPNVTINAQPESRTWPFKADAMFTSMTSDACDVFVHLKSIDSKPRKFYGAPSDVWIQFVWRNQSNTGSQPRKTLQYL